MNQPYACRPCASPIDIATHCAAISNLGTDWEDCWRGLLAGTRAFSQGPLVMQGLNWPDGPPIAAITALSQLGQAPSFADRFAVLAYRAAHDMRPLVDAVAQRIPRSRISVIIASSAGDPGCLSGLVDAEHRPGGYQATRSMREGLLGGPWAEPVTRALGWDYACTPVFGACASSLVGISYACDRINTGLTDAVLLLALDTLSRFACNGFARIGAAATDGCRPYDQARGGTTVGEGAVAVLLARPGVLEAADVAGRVSGTAVYCDAAHMVEPNPHGVAQVMRDAITRAGLTAADVRGVYWHGTGTVANDRTESAAARLVFGDRSPPCTSTKGSLGHTMGASGGFNVLAACATNATGWMPPVAGTTSPAFENLDLVLDAPRRVTPGPILITALGFGGINAATLLLPPPALEPTTRRAAALSEVTA